MAVEPNPYGFDDGLVPYIPGTTLIRTDVIEDKRLSFTALGLFASVISGALDPADAYKWHKNTSSNQIKTAVSELIAAGYVTEVGKSLAFNNQPTTK